MNEDAVPANCASSGAIQGMGAGSHPQSEPGVPRKKPLKVILNKAKMLTRGDK